MIFEQFFGRRKKEPQDDTLDVDSNFLERQRLEEEADQLLTKNSKPEEARNLGIETKKKSAKQDWEAIERNPRFQEWLRERDVSAEETVDDFAGETYNPDELGDPLFWDVVAPPDNLPFEEQDLTLEWKKPEEALSEQRRVEIKQKAPLKNEEAWKEWSPSKFKIMLDAAKFWRDKQKGQADQRARPTSLANAKSRDKILFSNEELEKLYTTFIDFRKRNPLVFAEMMVEVGEWQKAHFNFGKLDEKVFVADKGWENRYFTKDNPDEFFQDPEGNYYFKIDSGMSFQTPDVYQGVSGNDGDEVANKKRTLHLVSLQNRKPQKTKAGPYPKKKEYKKPQPKPETKKV